jgi:hypothetical protein
LRASAALERLRALYLWSGQAGGGDGGDVEAGRYVAIPEAYAQASLEIKIA